MSKAVTGRTRSNKMLYRYLDGVAMNSALERDYARGD